MKIFDRGVIKTILHFKKQKWSSEIIYNVAEQNSQ